MSEAIGVFDSGIGGLTVASKIKERFPHKRLIYFGDTLHLPYGDKSSKHIKNYIKAISAFLFAQKCDHLVVACNSASSVLPEVLDLPNFKSVTNVIDPVVEHVVANKQVSKVGVIGTKRTINSNVYQRKLNEADSNLEVYELPTPLLAPMIEEGFIDDTIAEKVIHEYLSELPQIDALILGCTHYPLIRNEINNYYEGKVKLFDAPSLVVETLENHLKQHNENDIEDHFFVSDFTQSFEKTAHQFFGKSIKLEKSNIFTF